MPDLVLHSLRRRGAVQILVHTIAGLLSVEAAITVSGQSFRRSAEPSFREDVYSRTIRPQNTTSPNVYIWNGDNAGTPAWLTSGNWSGGVTSTWPGVLAASSSGAGHPNDIAVFGPGTGAAAYGNVGINLNAANGSTLSLGAISSTGSHTLTIGQSGGTASLGVRSLVLNGAIAGNSAGLVAKTLLSAADGGILIKPNVGGGAASSPLGLRLGIADGIIDVASGRTITLNVSISEAGAGYGFTKTGAGTISLGGTGSYTGAVVINGGTVNAAVFGALGAVSNITVNAGGTLLLSGVSTVTDRINNASTITLNGGSFNTGGLTEGSSTAAGMGALTLQSNSLIDLGMDSSLLHFVDSHLATWIAGKILEIDNWSGLASGGGTDQLIFGSNSSGLTSGQIAEIVFHNPSGFATGDYAALILGNGELVPGTPIPEPGTWATGVFVLGGLICSERRRLLRRRSQA